MAEGGPSYSSTSAVYKDEIDEHLLRSLMEMGIHKDDARQALRIVNNRSLEDALAIVFGESPPNFSSDLPTVSLYGASVEQSTSSPHDSNVLPANLEINEDDPMTYRMLFVVNGSLRMSSGKMAAQVAHCAVDLYQDIIDRRLRGLNFWRLYGQTKIVVRGESTDELLQLRTKAVLDPSIATAFVRDAGVTEIASGSYTCLGLFGTKNQLDPITGHLKLMNDCLKCSSSPANDANQQKKSKRNRQDDGKVVTEETNLSSTDSKN